MAKLTLYHAAPSRSSITRWMLEEVGEPYDVHLLNLSKGDTHTPDYLAVNPMGKVPALKHGDAVITEAAAICAYLAPARAWRVHRLYQPACRATGVPARRGQGQGTRRGVR